MSALNNFFDACDSGNYNQVRDLVDSGVDINAHDHDSLNGLHLAVIEDHENIIPLLIEAGIDINAKINNGMTGLHIAAEKGLENIIPILIEAGIDINAQDMNGDNALDLAAFEGERRTQCLLVDAGCALTEDDLQREIIQYALAANAARREGAKNAIAEIDFPRRAAGSTLDSEFPQIRNSILGFIFLPPRES